MKNYPKEYLEGQKAWSSKETIDTLPPDSYTEDQKHDWWNGWWGDGEDEYEELDGTMPN